ncbi:MAG TPA: amino acid--tRNA ligase-related protein, partial [Kofleriaceae bacterium]
LPEDRPVFVTEYPAETSPLSRRNDADPAIVDRFELFIVGREHANAFSELNDPADQRARFQRQVDAKARGAEETMDYDEDYCRALEYGMPPTAGEGIGIDRLVMLLTDPELVASFKDPAQRPQVAAAILERYDSPEQRRVTAGHLGYLLFEATAEAKLVQPTFLTEFPLAVSPLARKNDRDGAFCDRFELFVSGKELANGFSELNDPDDQRARFTAQVTAKSAGAAETMDYDEDYCRALEVGMPPAAGEGIGIDRVTMMLTGQKSIREVILFPLMRPEAP